MPSLISRFLWPSWSGAPVYWFICSCFSIIYHVCLWWKCTRERMFNHLCYSLLRDSTAAARVAGASATTRPAAVGSLQRPSSTTGCAWEPGIFLSFFIGKLARSLSVIIRVLFYWTLSGRDSRVIYKSQSVNTLLKTTQPNLAIRFW